MAKSYRVVPGAARVLDVLLYLGTRVEPVSAGVIARDLDSPRSSIYRILSTLEIYGLAIRYAEVHGWGIGPAAYELGSGYARQTPLQRIGRAALIRVSRHTGYPAHIAVLDGSDVLYIVEQPGPNCPALITNVGVRLPAHLTASGRVIMANLPSVQVDAMYGSGTALMRRTGAGPRTLAELSKLLGDSRQSGYAVEYNEVTEGFTSVAAPIFDHNGRPAAACAITYLSNSLDSAQFADLRSRAISTANELSRRIHGKRPAPAAGPAALTAAATSGP